MGRYSYKGPVLEFGRLVAEDFQAETWAPTKAKAKSNLTYQFKKITGRIASTKISLPGKLVLEESVC